MGYPDRATANGVGGLATGTVLRCARIGHVRAAMDMVVSASRMAGGVARAWDGLGRGVQPEDSEKEVSVLKRGRLAVIESVWGHAGACVVARW